MFRYSNGDTLIFLGTGSTYTRAIFIEAATGETLATVKGISVPKENLADPDKNDLIDSLGNVRFYGSLGDDYILFERASEITAGAGNDTIVGGGYGQAGDDTFIPYEGPPLFSGGAGSDTADLTNVYYQWGLTVDLRRTDLQQVNDPGTLPYGVSLSFVSIENVEGSSGNDWITGNSAANTFRGRDGNDTLIGGAGNDVLDGGVGFDTADYSAFTSSTVKLSSTAAQSVGAAGSDRLISIEALIGGRGTDVFVGSATGNAFDGGGGNDRLNGAGGNDSILGGDGRDVLVGASGSDTLGGGNGEDVLDGGVGGDILAGGANADRLVFRSSIEANGDVIVDFDGSQGDRIDLRLIDANSAASGNQAFAFIGAADFSGVAGQLRYQTPSPNPGSPVFVQGDTNGDAVADFQITLLPGFSNPVVSDFLL